MGYADAFGGVFGLFSDIINSGNVNATNETNRWTTWATNEANLAINEEQLAWAREQYNKEVAENRFLVDQAYQRELENRQHNEWYNSPEQMMERYRRAGINPYLAMANGSFSGHVSAGSSVGSNTGQNPHANVPNMIPMQPPHDIPYTGFGQGISDGFKTALAMMANERQDYALASQIEVDHMNAYTNWVNALTEAKKAGADKTWIDAQIKLGFENLYLNQDKFARSVEFNNETLSLENRKVIVQEAEYYLKAYQTEADIRLSNKQIDYLGQLISQSIEEVGIAKEHEQHYGSLVANEVIHMINEDANAFERLGIDRELFASQKFRNYVGSVADVLWSTAAVFVGARSLGGRPSPIKGFAR